MANLGSETYADKTGNAYSVIYQNGTVIAVRSYSEMDADGLPSLVSDLTNIKNGTPLDHLDYDIPSYSCDDVDRVREDDPDDTRSDAEIVADLFEEDRDKWNDMYLIATDGRVDWDTIEEEVLSEALPELDQLKEE